MRSTSGQATLEYVAAVAVVALVLGAVAAGAAARDVAEAVHAGLVRSVCVVAGGECAADLQPCATAWRRDGRTWGARLLVVRLGGEAFVVRERRSDGTVALTLGHDGSGGVEVALGRRAGLLDMEVRAALVSGAEQASTWVLPDDRAADRLLAAVERWRRGDGGREPGLPPPDITYGTVARRGEAGAEAVLRPLGVDAAAEAGVVRGVRHDRATGRRTAYVERSGEWSASARAGGRVRGARRRDATGAARVTRGAGWSEQLAVTVDAHGRPVELQVVRVDPSGAVPAEAAAVAGRMPEGGRHVVVTDQRLDLTDPANRAAAASAVAALAAGRGAPRPAAALAARLREAAVVHVRAYAVDRRRREVGGAVGRGPLQVGGSRGTATEDGRLVAALTRGLGGGWTARSDCSDA